MVSLNRYTLWNTIDMLWQAGFLLVDINAADGNAALLDIPKRASRSHQRCFTRAARADKRAAGAFGNKECYSFYVTRRPSPQPNETSSMARANCGRGRLIRQGLAPSIPRQCVTLLRSSGEKRTVALISSP